MIRFTYYGSAFDRSVPPIALAIGPEAATVAGWSVGVTVDTRQTSATTWTITAQGETVTAEVVP